ncbi:hypothetical protein MMC22_000759 [Lobaria immixta]|nr:hypothetical protein [Lobaria immixta]
MALVNIWHLRKVAEAAAKPCDICYKPTTSVLITPDKQVACARTVISCHVKDRGFCSPIVNEAEVAAQKKKEEMDREMERIQEEYEEKMKKKKSKDKDNKDKGKGKDEKKEKEKDDERKADHNENTAEKEKNNKVTITAECLLIPMQDTDGIFKNAAVAGQAVAPNVEEMPRIYELHKVFYQKRLDRKRNAEIAKRDRERLNALKNPALFPSVPRNNLG